MSVLLRLLIFLAVVIVPAACQEDTFIERFEEVNWIPVAHVQMPVLYTGNTQSNTVLLIVHGGPGNSSLEYLGLFERHFGEDFLLAFWDQRYSGFSKFDFTLSMTMESNISDCHLVITEIKKRFPDKKIVLWGHHWGGAIVMGVASHPTFKDAIAGWIVVNGMVSGFEYFRSRWQFALRRSRERLAEGAASFADTVAVLQRLEPRAGQWRQATQTRIDGIANRLLYPGEPATARELETFTTSRIRQVFPAQRERDRARLNVAQEPNAISFSRTLYVWQPALAEINKPGLLLWGAKDEKCPVELLTWLSSELRNRNKNVTIQRYEEAWDTPFFNQPEKHALDIKAFLQTLN